MNLSRFDPYAIAESITEQAATIAAQMTAAGEVTDQQTLTLCRNVAAAAVRLLDCAADAVEQGDKKTALFSLACASGAARLIEGLVSDPDSEELCQIAAPFATQQNEVMQ
jgi:hypothetical protein